jgi:hypothetical protein
MDSQQFLDWLEHKLQAAGVEKVVPDADALAVAYRQQRRTAKFQKILDEAMAEPDGDTPVPGDLAEQIRARITNTAAPWDAALWDIVREQDDALPDPAD